MTGLDRLRYLVGQAHQDTYTTATGIVKPKTKKQREIEWAVATEVVRFAFDHGGITEGHLAPGGLMLQLMAECGAIPSN